MPDKDRQIGRATERRPVKDGCDPAARCDSEQSFSPHVYYDVVTIRINAHSSGPTTSERERRASVDDGNVAIGCDPEQRPSDNVSNDVISIDVHSDIGSFANGGAPTGASHHCNSPLRCHLNHTGV